MSNILRVVAVGDSAMWGQGLKRADTYANLAAERIADRLGKNLAFMNLAHSGAKLEATIDRKQASVYTLPSKKAVPTFRGDRHTFIDRFPGLFKTDEEVIRFLDETINDQKPTGALFGDIPATFPTITYQIRSVPDAEGKTIDLVLMNGSVNDVDYSEVLDPDGDPLEVIEKAIKGATFDKLKRVLRRARNKFPNAVIIYTGYFPPFTRGSDSDRLERLFKYLKDLPGWKLLANDFLEHPVGAWTPLGMLGNAFVDTAEDKVRESIARAEFAFGRGLFWIRRAIFEVAGLDPRSPGIIFAHPGFTSENALFGDTPLLHEGYHPPSAEEIETALGGLGVLVDLHPVRDALRQERLEKFPRIGLISRLQNTRKALSVLNMLPQTGDLTLPQLQPKLRGLRDDLDGPQSLRAAVDAIANGPFDRNAVKEAIAALDKETGSLKIAQIASFLHPNEAGARRYADVIVHRYQAFRHWELKAHLRKLVTKTGQPSKPQSINLNAALRRYGLDPARGLQACFQHMIVDCISLETETEKATSSFTTMLKVRISDSKEWSLRNPIGQFKKAGTRDLFTIDTGGTLHLGDIDRLTLEIIEIGVREPARVTKLRSVALGINGKLVFQAPISAAAKEGNRFVFPYPR